MSDDLFSGVFATPAVDARTDSRACLQALLDVEAALARSEAAVGLIPIEAATAISACCVADHFSAAELGRRATEAASVVVPLVADLRSLVPAEARAAVHAGATSQDVIDTATSLIAARTLDPVLADVDAITDTLAALAQSHRDTVQIGRTLLQHAVPTTFGAVCAGWLVGLDEAGDSLRRVRTERLAVQLGGAAGTLAGLGDRGLEVVDRLAAELGLCAPILPWHTNRVRVGELAAAVGLVAGALGTISLNVTLLAQNEIGEVAEGAPGGSSSMPHKRNPSRSVQVTACVAQIPGLVASIFAALPQEGQRSAGRWQAEWPVVVQLLRLIGAAAAHGRVLVEELQVHADRMRSNVEGAGDVDLGMTATLVDRALEAHRARRPDSHE
jgi:3-carboxy-cis,cis-muconate cycloisomerase